MPLILPGNVASATASTGYDVDNSCRFDGSSGYMSRSTGVTTTNTKFTISFWQKMTDLTNFQWMFETYKTSSERFWIGFNLDDAGQPKLEVSEYQSAYIFRKIFTRVFRDPSAWYNFVIRFDSTESTDTDRLRIYVNGVEETVTDHLDLPAEDGTSIVSVGTQYIQYSQNNTGYGEGYLSEFVLIEGSALAPTEFGEFDEDSPTIWKPKDVSGLTFGTNGFYLDFKDSADLGADVSGNSNDFTVTNLDATDQATDTPTNNFATMNPLAYRLDSGVALVTYSEGNLKTAFTDGTYGTSTMATIGVTTGKWYWEAKATAVNDTCFVGITKAEYDPNDNFAGRSMYYGNAGPFWAAGGTGGTTQNPYGNTWTTGDIIGVAFDATNGVIWFSKDGAWQNSATIAEIGAGTTTNAATTGITTGQTWMPFGEGTNETLGFNFGGCPAFTVSSGNADADGYGNFEYAVPSGYYALCTKNLAEYG